MKPTIVITDCDHDSLAPEFEVAEEYGVELVSTRSMTADEVVANAQDADGIVVQYARIDGPVLDRLPNVKVIGRYGVGVDTIDMAAATERGVAVCNVPDYGTESVSDHAIGLVLTVSRGIARLDRGIRAGSVDLVPIKPAYTIRGRTLGIIGLGLIGTATARKARGLGYEVIAYDIKHEPGTEVDGVPMSTLDDVLRRSDVISVHVPLTDESHHLLGAEQFALMRPHAILVNTSRGGVVDSDALVAALTEGQLHGAGLDVLETEPVPEGHPLTEFDTVVLTPHSAWYTEESYTELKRRTVENVARVLTGAEPRNVLNPEALG